MGPRGPVTSAVVHKKINTVIDRIAGARPQKLERLPYPDGLCEEAFAPDDGMCVPWQMVEVLAPDCELGDIQNQMDDIHLKIYPDRKDQGARRE